MAWTCKNLICVTRRAKIICCYEGVTLYDLYSSMSLIIRSSSDEDLRMWNEDVKSIPTWASSSFQDTKIDCENEECYSTRYQLSSHESTTARLEPAASWYSKFSHCHKSFDLIIFHDLPQGFRARSNFQTPKYRVEEMNMDVLNVCTQNLTEKPTCTCAVNASFHMRTLVSSKLIDSTYQYT